MYEYQRLAKKYGIDVEFFNASQFLSTKTRFPSKIDIGFCADEGNLLTKLFSPFRRERLGPGLYVYGSCATSLAKYLRDDERLCGTLRFVLAQYAYAVEWSGQKLTARINVFQGDPRQDGTGGERLLSTFSEIARYLSRIEASLLEAQTTRRKWWGPRRLRILAGIAGAALPFVFVATMVIYFSPHPAHPAIR
jgi:hypothetical protein